MNISGMNFKIPQNISIGVEKSPVKLSEANALPSAAQTEDLTDISKASLLTSKKASSVDRPKTDSLCKASETEAAPEIIVMREKGLDALVKQIDGAKKSIDLHIYIITANTPELMDAFHRALERGVKVRLMVEDDPFYWTQSHANPSESAIKELVASGAEYKPDNPAFSKSRVTHEKSMVFDNERAMILTGNLGSTTFGKNLDLGAILINNPKVVKQIETIFNSDWERTPLPDLGNTNLVVSPDNARSKLTELLTSAKKSIQVLQQGFTDKAVISLLAEKLKSGVKTELTLTDPGIAQGNMQSAAYLALKGADVNFLVSPYIHAKAVEIDAGEKDSQTYIGSQNFSMSAIDKNRELGYIFHDDKKQLPEIIERYRTKGFEIPSKMVISDPSAIGSSVKSAMRTAEEKIILQTNLFSDSASVKALIDAAKRGVKVSVMMPENPFPWDPNCTTNKDAAEKLKAAGVKVQWTENVYKSMQGTCLLVDGKESITFPDNMSASAFKYNNSYGVINISQKDVKETEQILEGDLSSTKKAGAADLSPTSEIVVSPGNARQQLKSLINGATKGLKVTTKDITDPELISALKEKASKGVPVFLITGQDPKNEKDAAILKDLAQSGVKIQTMTQEKLFNNYIEMDKEKAFIGSQSLTQKSLDEHHGFGNMVTHPEMLRIARGTFSEHWEKAALQSAQKEITISASNIDSNRTLIELLSEAGKRGVKVKVTCNNYDKSVIKAQLETFNNSLRDIIKLDPKTEENKEILAKFFGEFFEPDKALQAQQDLAATIAGLKKGEEIFEGSNSSAEIKEMAINIDGKKLERLPSRAEEIGELTPDPDPEDGAPEEEDRK